MHSLHDLSLFALMIFEKISIMTLIRIRLDNNINDKLK
jgi:hypothetical protein